MVFKSNISSVQKIPDYTFFTTLFCQTNFFAKETHIAVSPQVYTTEITCKCHFIEVCHSIIQLRADICVQYIDVICVSTGDITCRSLVFDACVSGITFTWPFLF